MSKARDIADLGSNDVLETSSTGLDVTGTVTADGLTVDGGITANLGSANKVKLNGNYPYVDFAETDTTDVNTRLQSSSGNFLLRTVNDADTAAYTRLKVDHATGNVSFYEDTGTTAKMVWDASAENLSINSNGAFPLSLDSDHGETILKLDNSSTNGRRYWLISGGSAGSFSGGKFGVYDADSLSTPFVINSAGNVGIGEDNPSAKLDVGTVADSAINMSSSADGILRLSGANYSFAIANNDTGTYLYNNGFGRALVFGNNETERARLDSSGNLLVGTTSISDSRFSSITPGDNHAGYFVNDSSNFYSTLVLRNDATTSTRRLIDFRQGNTVVGRITHDGSSTTYSTTSDYRLKENVVVMDNASDRVKALKPCRFNFIADPDNTVDGFLAHEAQEVVPEAVTGTKDAVDADGNPEYQGIDQSKLVPLLTKALQEALTKIEQLETRIETLENN